LEFVDVSQFHEGLNSNASHAFFKKLAPYRRAFHERRLRWILMHASN